MSPYPLEVGVRSTFLKMLDHKSWNQATYSGIMVVQQQQQKQPEAATLAPLSLNHRTIRLLYLAQSAGNTTLKLWVCRYTQPVTLNGDVNILLINPYPIDIIMFHFQHFLKTRFITNDKNNITRTMEGASAATTPLVANVTVHGMGCGWVTELPKPK